MTQQETDPLGAALDSLAPGLADAIGAVKRKYDQLEPGEDVAVVCSDAVVVVGLDHNQKLTVQVFADVIHHDGAVFEGGPLEAAQ